MVGLTVCAQLERKKGGKIGTNFYKIQTIRLGYTKTSKSIRAQGSDGKRHQRWPRGRTLVGVYCLGEFAWGGKKSVIKPHTKPPTGNPVKPGGGWEWGEWRRLNSWDGDTREWAQPRVLLTFLSKAS